MFSENVTTSLINSDFSIDQMMTRAPVTIIKHVSIKIDSAELTRAKHSKKFRC